MTATTSISIAYLSRGAPAKRAKKITVKKKGAKLTRARATNRTLSAYNIFFGFERARILALSQSGQSISNLAPPTNTTPEQVRIFFANMPKQTGDGEKKRRKHRKTHGVVSFVELNRIVSSHWKALDERGKRPFYVVAGELKARHAEEQRNMQQSKGRASAVLNNGVDNDVTEVEKPEKCITATNKLKEVMLLPEPELESIASHAPIIPPWSTVSIASSVGAVACSAPVAPASAPVVSSLPAVVPTAPRRVSFNGQPFLGTSVPELEGLTGPAGPRPFPDASLSASCRPPQKFIIDPIPQQEDDDTAFLFGIEPVPIGDNNSGDTSSLLDPSLLQSFQDVARSLSSSPADEEMLPDDLDAILCSWDADGKGAISADDAFIYH